MHLLKKDIAATVLVAAGGVIYLLKVTDVILPGTGGTRAAAAIILAVGFAASTMAVVPGFEDLMHGSRLYLITASALGVAALVSGIIALVTGSSTALAVLTAATVVMWLMATIRHAAPAAAAAPTPWKAHHAR